MNYRAKRLSGVDEEIDNRNQGDHHPYEVEPEWLVIFPVISFNRDPQCPGKVE